MKIITTGPVNHDGKDVEIGATLSLPNRQALALIEAGAAEAAGRQPKQDDGAEGAEASEGEQ